MSASLEASKVRRPDRTYGDHCRSPRARLRGDRLVREPQAARACTAHRETGTPLTKEQQSVDFQTADLTFDVQPNAHRIDGRAMLGFLVKAPIAKLQFDLDPELPIESIAADGQMLQSPRGRTTAASSPSTLPRRKRPATGYR